jgi:hypothetical protein
MFGLRPHKFTNCALTIVQKVKGNLDSDNNVWTLALYINELWINFASKVER